MRPRSGVGHLDSASFGVLACTAVDRCVGVMRTLCFYMAIIQAEWAHYSGILYMAALLDKAPNVVRIAVVVNLYENYKGQNKTFP